MQTQLEILSNGITEQISILDEGIDFYSTGPFRSEPKYAPQLTLFVYNVL